VLFGELAGSVGGGVCVGFSSALFGEKGGKFGDIAISRALAKSPLIHRVKS